jgi:hypothetical protein
MQHIKIQPEILSDGSSSWSVIFSGTTFDCFSKECAYTMAESFVAAIKEGSGDPYALDEDWLITSPGAE